MGDVIATSLSTVYVAAGSATILSISAQQLFVSSIQATNIIGALTTANLTSTVIGLGTAGYLSSTTGFISTANLANLISTANLANLVSTSYLASQLTSSIIGLGTIGYVSTASLYSSVTGSAFTGSTLSLSTGNVIASSINLIDTLTQSTGTIYQTSSLLYFNNYVIGGAFTLFAQIYSA
jgi:hypothetical protein